MAVNSIEMSTHVLSKQESNVSLNKDVIINKKKLSTRSIAFTDENLMSIKKINSILLHCGELTISQKLDYCNIQRFYMKLYLQGVVKRLHI